jgi:hypothetical protein
MSKGFLATMMSKAKRVRADHDRTPAPSDKEKASIPKGLGKKKKKNPQKKDSEIEVVEDAILAQLEIKPDGPADEVEDELKNR